MRQIASLLIALLIFAAITPTKAQVNKQDSLALVDLYNSTGGASWTNNANWLTKAPVSTWNGIILDSSERVSQINLAFNNLTGTLPNSIGNLTHLTTIGLHINSIGGNIPASIGRLTNLTSLDLGENNFTGTIPDSLASLTNITQLDLDANQLTGGIPSWIGNFKNLQDLWLQYNNFSGSIPSSIGNLKGLQYLVLQNNQLSGTIPASFGNLNNLQGLFLQNNNFTFAGMELIVTKFPSATYFPQAEVLLRYSNSTFSVSVGGTPANDTYFWYLNGTIVATKVGDSTFTPTSNGQYYVVATNAIAGELNIFSDTINITNYVSSQDSLALVDLYKSTNGASWTNNTNWLTKAPLNTWNGITLDSSERVSQINLAFNNLTGTLPNSIGNLTHLTSISLHINAIGGNIPASIGRLTNLTSLDLGENKFTGTIPDSLASLVNLTALDLDGNQITGTIPSWIGNFSNLQFLWLQYNSLTDSIPSSIGNLTALQYLVLQNNQLSGAIPASFGNLNNLQGLFLQNNNFTFAGMELVATKFPFAQYAPQAPIPLHSVTTIGNSDVTMLWVSVGGTSTKNVYQWFNLNGIVATISKDSAYEPLVSDYYYVQVLDSLVPGLTLHSDTLKVYTTVPIKGINLQAKETNGQVLLQWQTIDEINTASFIVQHSADGITFTDIATKTAVGSGNNSYSLVDESPAEGINYYRIKAVDKNGSITYSSSVHVSIVNYKLSIYPNPSKGNVTIQGNHIASIEVFDNLGREVSLITLHDATNPSISVSNLSVGAYYLHVKTTNGEESVVKLIKE